jgi:lipase maturation factor
MEGSPQLLDRASAPRHRAHPLRWLFDPEAGSRTRFVPRWIFLRALGAIYFSAFFSLLFQIEGLNGPRGILPAQHYLSAVQGQLGYLRFWYVPSLFWLSSGSRIMLAVVWIGLIASIAVIFNAWPRLSLFLCLICFMSFVTAAQDFSSYQSDGMLLEAGFIALFFAPRGLWPRWGIDQPVIRAGLFLLQWEWFRIYFESGVVKLLSGDPEWRHYTAMDEYYQNGPLPTWIGYYIQHLPHRFQASTAFATLAMELGIVLMLFFPRSVRFICFCIVTPWEAVVILTANYTFLNYLVLSLGFLLLDDRSVRWLLPRTIRCWLPPPAEAPPQAELAPTAQSPEPAQEPADPDTNTAPRKRAAFSRIGQPLRVAGVAVSALMLTWVAYATTAQMVRLLWSSAPLPSAPIEALEPFRIANQYGLFAVMTRGRYEIEFQGSNDGQTWTAYPFRYKPQALNEAPGIYAPYQPRFEWNLWFASLGDWQQYNFVPLTEERLLENDPDVLSLFRSNPFPQSPPRFVKAVLWQYWFTTLEEKRRTGNWWKRDLMGLYAPELTRQPDGRFAVIEWPEELPPHD